MLKSEELNEKILNLVDELEDLADDGEAYEKKMEEIERAKKSYERALNAEEMKKNSARPVGREKNVENERPKFGTLAENLRAIANYYSPEREMDKRLIRAPLGHNETDASAGGFLVQTDFASTIWKRAFELSPLVGQTTKIPISTNANGIKIPAVVDDSRKNGSRWGGVRMHWVAEGETVPTSGVKIRQIELDLKKIMGVWNITEEILEDASVLETIAYQAFSEELSFSLADAIFSGDGVGKPLGFMNSPAKVTVAKESGQAAKTIVKENVDNMYSRLWPRSIGRAAWFYNPDVWPQFNRMAVNVGTGGVPVFLPPGGINGQPYGSLYGIPMFPIEHAETLGTEGDLCLLDLSQYLLADKSGAKFSSSMHVRFVYDEATFKVTYRVDGRSAWNAPVTPYKGTNTLSPFITLATRA